MFLLIRFPHQIIPLTLVLFTFQYVSINTYGEAQSVIEQAVFTFQYVSINTMDAEESGIPICTLHSNMFLLIP